MYRLLLLSTLLISALSAQIFETEGNEIRYTTDGPFAVVEGDMILGRTSDLDLYRAAQGSGKTALRPNSLAQNFSGTGAQLWTNATIYYTVDSDVPNQQRILDGIAQWNTRTQFKILPRTTEKNYVRFQRVFIDAACNSYVGMLGGEQILGVTDNCPVGSVVHELGHAWGLLHEQQRSDRGGNMTVLYENIDKRFHSAFNQSVGSSTDLSFYDFGSIMQYPATGFSRNYLDSMETVPPGIPIGQRDGLSAGDIDAVTRLYRLTPDGTTITTNPTGLPITVDGVAATSPRTYAWAPGTAHTIGVSALQGVDPRYVFARWSDGGAASHVVTASTALTVFAANFLVQHKVQSGVFSGQGTVTLAPAPADGYLPERAQFSVTATPAAGASFLRWTGNTYLGSTGNGISSNPASVEMQNAFSNYQGAFTTGAMTTIASEPRGAIVTVDGAQYITPANLLWTAGTAHTLSAAASQLQGNNTRRLQFKTWDDGSTGTRTVTAGVGAATYTANFNEQFRLSTDVAGPGSVVAVPSSADEYYDAGTTVQLIATPAAGQTLRFWLGDLAGGLSPATVVIDQQRDVTAAFGSALPFRVLNSASYQSNPLIGSTSAAVSPGEIVAVFGNSIGPDAAAFGAADASGRLPLTLNGTTVTFDGQPAPIIYVSKGQINVVVPFGVAGKTSSVVRIASLAGSVSSTVSIASSIPSLFTYDGSGKGPVAALNADYSVNSPANPAGRESIVVLYGTGAGTFDKSFPDGQLLGVDLGRPTQGVWVRFGKLPGDILYAGTAPFLVNGALQVNVRVPADLPPGPVAVQLIVGSWTSPTGTTISVK
ncbi:MAG: hypothetical protein JWN34_4567 [Bryobacterales bacterium]|nr:hypothetical protein [Bryobacterales bacterium]